MEAFCPLKTKITPSGRPSYCTGEVEVLQQQGVGFYDGETRSSYESGTLYLTTHRLVWVDGDLKLMRGIYAPLTKINLGSVRRWFGLGPLSHPKLFVYLAEKPNKYFKMSFRKYGMDAFCSSLGATGKKQAWVAKPISDYDVLAPPPVEPVKAEKLKLHPDQCSQEGGVHVVTEANTTHGAVAVLKGLGGGPLAKAVFRFKAVGGLYDLQFSFSSSDRKQSISVRANTNASARLELAPGSAEVSTIVVLEAGDNVLSIAPNLVQLEEAPPPLSVHGVVLVPAAKGRPLPQGKSSGAPQLGGISGIVTKLDKQDATEAAKMSDAMQDIDALMVMAEDISQMVTQLQSKIAQGVRGAPREEQDEIERSQAELNNMISEMGLTSVVTRGTVGHGGSYTTELAKQLLDFLQAPLERQTGTMSILDAFCLYNLARGTDLISPDDMWRACEKLRTLPGSNINFMEVGSTHLLRLDDVAGDSKLLSLLPSSAECLTPLGLATALKVSARVAHEILDDAEGRGIVCRDAQHPDGVSFHRNIFCHPL